MIIHSPIISGSLTFAEGSTFTLPDGGEYSGSFSGSVQVHELQSHVIPNSSASYDLGSAAFPFRDLYLSAETLKLGGLKLNGIGNKLTIKDSSDETADVEVKSIKLGGLSGNTVKLGLGSAGKVSLLDENDDEAQLEVSKIILKDTSGAGKNTILTNDGGQFTTQEADDSGTITSADAAGALSGSFTGSIQDAVFNGDTIFSGSSIRFQPLPHFSSGIAVTGSIEATTFVGMISSSAQVEFNPIIDNPFSQSLNSVTTTKSIIPTTNTIDLGSVGSPFRDLYLSSASLYIDGQQVISTADGDLNITTDANQSLRLIEEGSDTITLQTADGDITLTATGNGNIELDAPIQIAAGKNILSSDGNAISFANSISVTGDISITGTVDGVDVSTLKSNVDTHVSASDNPHSVTAAQVGLGNVTNESKTTMFSSPTFTGTVSGVTATHVGLGSVDNTSDADKPVSTAQQTALDLKATVSDLNTEVGRIDAILAASDADKDSFAEIVTLINSVDTTNDSAFAGFVTSSNAAQAVQDGRLSSLETQSGSISSDLSTHIADTTNPHSVTATQVGLGNVTNESKATMFTSPTFTGTVSGVTATHVGLGNVTNESKSTMFTSPTFTGTVSGVSKSMVGLGNVDNTADADKPVSTAQQTALNLKANLASPTFTGTVSGVSKSMVGLGNVDNTADSAKPVSTAQQTALNLKYDASNPSGFTTYTSNQATNTTSGVTFASVAGGTITGTSVSVTGDVVAYASSDSRLKDNVKNIENPIQKVQSLNGVTWDWNDNADELQKSIPNVGVIAQEVEQVLPQLVKDRENGYKGVDYAKLTGLLIEAVKEQQKQIDELKARLG